MPLIEGGKVVADSWTRVADADALPLETPAIVSLARLRREGDALLSRNAPLGVLVPADTQAEDIADLVDRVSLFVIEFPKFRDGRGYTIARSLREHYHFKGELRATGHTLPDQYTFLLRCGFNSVDIPEAADAERWAEAMRSFDIAYQSMLGADETLSGLRRRLELLDPPD
jgi:uncharacterized protein (DUF934 family)